MPKAQASSSYRYAYLYPTFGDKPPLLALVNPAKLEETQTIELPLLPQVRFSLHGAIPDPTGKWLLLPFTSYQSGARLHLYDPITAEMIEIAEGNFALRDVQGHPDQHIVWSPDGQFIAFSVEQALTSTSLEKGVYIYDIANQSITQLAKDLAYFSRLAWSRDSKFLAVSIQRCPEASTWNCDYSLATFGASTGQQQLSVSLTLPESSSAGLDTLCSLDWSPDNRFISFVPFCSREPMNPPIEVYVWDTVQGVAYPVTDFTSSVKQPPDRVYLAAYYETIWIAPDTLLIGAFWDDGITLNTRTISVQLPDKTIVEVMPEAMEAAALHPTTSDLAYRTVSTPPIDPYYLPNMENPKLAVGTVDGTRLVNKSTIATNACRLAWSPDGTMLAYTIQKELGMFGRACSGLATGLGFMDVAIGAVAEYVIPTSSDPDQIQFPVPIGWVRVP
ncbi:MAG: hypothetical protein U0528_20430 [Anaerolineae bacterium]